MKTSVLLFGTLIVHHRLPVNSYCTQCMPRRNFSALPDVLLAVVSCWFGDVLVRSSEGSIYSFQAGEEKKHPTSVFLIRCEPRPTTVVTRSLPAPGKQPAQHPIAPWD